MPETFDRIDLLDRIGELAAEARCAREVAHQVFLGARHGPNDISPGHLKLLEWYSTYLGHLADKLKALKDTAPKAAAE